MSFSSSLLHSSTTSITSVPSLLQELSLPLELLHLLPPSSASSSAPTTPPSTRQFQLIQLNLLNQTWLTWLPAATDASERVQLESLLKRWFIAPITGEREHVELVLGTLELLLGYLSGSAGTTTSTEGSAGAGEGGKKLPKTKEQLQLASGLLADLVLDEWKLQDVFEGLVGDSHVTKRGEREEKWDDYVKLLGKVPMVVANAFGKVGLAREMNEERFIDLQYFPLLAQQYTSLLLSLSTSTTAPSTSTSTLLPPLQLLVPSFTSSLLTSVIPHLLPPSTLTPTPSSELLARKKLSSLWLKLLKRVPNPKREKLEKEVLATVGRWVDAGKEAERRERIEGGGWLLSTLLGEMFSAGTDDNEEDEDDEEVDEESLLKAILLDPRSTSYSPSLALAVVRWCERSSVSVIGSQSPLERMLGLVSAAWCNADGIKNANQGFRIYISTLFLALLTSLSSSNRTSTIQSLSRTPLFLSAISGHLNLSSHRRTIRLLGMMVAEEVSILSYLGTPISATGEGPPKLSFGEIWEEDNEDVRIVQEVRKKSLSIGDSMIVGDKNWQELLRKAWGRIESPPSARTKPLAVSLPPSPAPIPAPSKPLTRSLITEIHDPSDLQPLPLAPLPPPSFIQELETPDASLYATLLPKASTSTTRSRGKLRPPVYIPELIEYLRGKETEGKKEEADEEAERVMVGLREGEGLVRRKKGWGGELEENATELAGVLVGLQDQFETEGFEKHKLDILVALVAACPVRVAPNLIEHYYMANYTLVQRHAILTALALGARELAGLPSLASPPSTTSQPTPKSVDPPPTPFPSKQLPPALHARLLSLNTTTPTPNASSFPLPLPSGALETITASLTSTALSSAKAEAEETIPEARREKLLTVRRFASAPRPSTSSSDNSQTNFATIAAEHFIMPLINRLFLHLRDLETSPSKGRNPYAGGEIGTGLLDVLLLPTYLGTLSVLLHAARHSPHFLAVLVPESMELVFVLRTVTSGGDPEVIGAEEGEPEIEEKILQTSLELLLVVVDASVALDGGSTLMRNRGASEGGRLVVEAREWAEKVFEREEGRAGGVGACGRAAAGVLLRVEEVMSKWRGKVGW